MVWEGCNRCHSSPIYLSGRFHCGCRWGVVFTMVVHALHLSEVPTEGQDEGQDEE